MSRFKPCRPTANVEAINLDGLPSFGEHRTREPALPPLSIEVLKSVRTAILMATAIAIAACASAQPQGPNPFSVAVAFDSPPAYPGYQWTRNGQAVPTAELGASAGPNHCDWQSATILTISWPLGTVAQTSAHSRSYIRDPNGVIGGTYKQRLVKDAPLPATAKPTGYKLGSIEVYLSPADQDEAVYVVAPSGTERWPRADPMFGCQ
jgi:hypothetical protein